MPIGNFPMLSGFMQRQRKQGQQGQQMPTPPAQYMPEQNVAVPEPGAAPSHQPQQGVFQQAQQPQQQGMWGQMKQAAQRPQPAQQGMWGGVSQPGQPVGQAKQQQFNQEQSRLNTGTPGGKMNRRRF
jgi:hypothetical protein